MINFLLGFLLLIVSPVTDSGFFEGTIKMVEESHYDTTYYTYVIKDNQIRVDKFDHNHNSIQSLLVHLEKKEIIVLSPTKKLFTHIELSSNACANDENLTIIKTKNSRPVNGTHCNQWRVRNKEHNTEITYWVSENNFSFFAEFTALMNHSEQTFKFFDKIPESQGFFPMLMVERTLLRKVKRRVAITEIKPQTINDKLFEIPTDYKEISN